MIIGDEGKANDCLNRIGYYRLSGYWFLFRQRDANGSPVDLFKSGTAFETVISLYYFDKNLRLLMLDAIERIEIALRVHICLYLGRLGPLAHRDPNTFDGTFSRRRDPKTKTILHRDWLDRIDAEFGRSKEDFAKHFRSKYPGESPPIWIACEVWDFGRCLIYFLV